MRDDVKIINLLHELIEKGKSLKKEKYIKSLFPEYRERVIITLNLITTKLNDPEIAKKANEIRSLKIKDHLSIVDKFLMLRFRADYLSDWSTAGKYKSQIDKINLKLLSILKSLQPDI